MRYRPRHQRHGGTSGSTSRDSRVSDKVSGQIRKGPSVAMVPASTLSAGGVSDVELIEVMRKIEHPVRLDDVMRYLDLSRREKKPLEALLVALEVEGRVMRLRGGKWVESSQARMLTGTLSVQRSGAGFVTPDAGSFSPAKQICSEKKSSRPGGGARELPGDIFIHPGFLGDAWHGDRVEVVVSPPRPERERRSGQERERRAGQERERYSGRRGDSRSGGRPEGRLEGRILRVLERSRKECVAYVTRERTASGVLCRPADPRLDFLLDVDTAALESVPRTGELLLVSPGEKLEDRFWSGTALRSIGFEDAVSVQERLVKLNHEIPLDFPPNVLAEAETLQTEEQDRDGLPAIPDSGPFVALTETGRRSTSERQDLRVIPFVTIDGEDARDFDDAVYVRAVLESGNPVVWELWVAIADVSHFVVPHSRLDRESRERGNSYYFPASVEPMLPEILSNDLCSLRPDVDRLVMAVRIGFDATGNPRTSAFFPGLIRSRARLTYEQVEAALTSSQMPDASDLLRHHEWLRDASTLARLLQQRRAERGGLDFDLPEAHFIIDSGSGRVSDVQRKARLSSHRLIEAFMLAANEAVASFLEGKGIPFPYRVHPAPDPDRFSALRRTLEVTGLVHNAIPSSASGSSRSFYKKATRKSTSHVSRRASGPADSDRVGVSPEVLRRILNEAKGTPGEYMVSRLVLRSLMQARYAPESGIHFGLASQCYCHFTSPIRRYADLMVHRALRYGLGSITIPLVGGQKLLAITDQCNVRERSATEAEREIRRRLSCLLLQDRIGEIFTGVIAGVSDFGFFVELDAMPIEGVVRLESFTHDFFEYNPDRQELISLSSKKRFRIGQAVTVRLARVHVGRLEIDLEVVKGK